MNCHFYAKICHSKKMDLNSSVIGHNHKANIIFRDYYVDNILVEYEQGPYIGEGMSCKVYKCRRRDDPNSVDANYWPLAIKIFDGNYLAKLDSKYLIRELEQLIRINHPCIIHIEKFSIHQDPTKINAIVTRFFSNGSLEEAKNRGILSDIDKMKAAYGIASTFSYLHQYQIIHRDLKLQNVFLDENKEIVIGDLGFARKIVDDNNDDINMTIVGTPLYMPPEIHSTIYDSSVDVFSYGVLLYMLLTPNERSLRFNDPQNTSPKDRFALADLFKKGYRPQDNNDIPPGFLELIHKCWDDNPSKRPSFGRIIEMFLDPQFNLYIEGIDNDDFLDYVDKIDSYAGKTEVSDEDFEI